VKDGAVRRALKRVALWSFRLDVAVHRAWRRRGGERPFLLGGECRRCARCCEAPALQVGRAVWYLPALRRLFLWWQERVNGFVLVDRDRGQRVFVFRCTHFDPQSRSCDSYDSRPGVCRDYPRALLWETAPDFFPECGYRPVAANAAGLIRYLERAGVPPDQMERVRKGLHL
jgi:Fe-S-cluster containining protein